MLARDDSTDPTDSTESSARWTIQGTRHLDRPWAARLMVCTSPDKDADAELLAGAALAEELHASWFAVSVTPAAHGVKSWLAPTTPPSFARNARLAETLGAIIVDVTAPDAAEGVVAFAKGERITHAIFGHSDESASILARGSVVQRFASAVRGVEVRVVRRGTKS